MQTILSVKRIISLSKCHFTTDQKKKALLKNKRSTEVFMY